MKKKTFLMVALCTATLTLVACGSNETPTDATATGTSAPTQAVVNNTTDNTDVTVTEAPVVTEPTVAPTSTPIPTKTPTPTEAPIPTAPQNVVEPTPTAVPKPTTPPMHDFFEVDKFFGEIMYSYTKWAMEGEIDWDTTTDGFAANMINDFGHCAEVRAALTVLKNHHAEFEKLLASDETCTYFLRGLYPGDNWDEIIKEYKECIEVEALNIKNEEAAQQQTELDKLNNVFLNISEIKNLVLYNENGVTLTCNGIILDGVDTGRKLLFTFSNQNPDNKKVSVIPTGISLNGIDVQKYFSFPELMSGESTEALATLEPNAYIDGMKRLGYEGVNSEILTVDFDFMIRIGSKSEYESKRVSIKTANYSEDAKSSLYGNYVMTINTLINEQPLDVYVKDGYFGFTVVLVHKGTIGIDLFPYLYVNGMGLVTNNAHGTLSPNKVSIINSSISDDELRRQNELGKNDPLEYTLQIEGRDTQAYTIYNK